MVHPIRMPSEQIHKRLFHCSSTAERTPYYKDALMKQSCGFRGDPLAEPISKGETTLIFYEF